MDDSPQPQADMVAMNEALLLGAGRQDELTEEAGKLNEQLRAEIILREKGVAECPPTAPASPAPAAREAPRRILIVDDDEDSTRSMAILQRRRGHETRTAFTGPDAVAAAVEFLPEVVLLDIGLPGMDGYEVARRLRAMPALAGIFLVAMSGYGSDEDRAQAKLAGFDEHLVKPVDHDLLREWLRSRD